MIIFDCPNLGQNASWIFRLLFCCFAQWAKLLISDPISFMISRLKIGQICPLCACVVGQNSAVFFQNVNKICLLFENFLMSFNSFFSDNSILKCNTGQFMIGWFWFSILWPKMQFFSSVFEKCWQFWKETASNYLYKRLWRKSVIA